MAQLRQDYEQFVDRDAEIVVVGPEDINSFRSYWERHDLPFIGLADPEHLVADRYGQEVKLLRWGRLPALLVIDKQGDVQYRHYGGSMSDIPPNQEILSLLEELNWEQVAVQMMESGRATA